MDNTQEQIVGHYETLSHHPVVYEYYGRSYFLNFGYWDDQTPDQKSACENLVEKLLSFVPDKRGTILDVACGNGATTAHLMKYYAADKITAINISTQQLEIAGTVAPGCHFLLMDATRLDFPDNSIDNMISVEAAFHFNTREKFLREALRVLKPGGWIVLSDILVTPEAEKNREMRTEANYLENPAAYRDLLQRTGYEEFEVIDATEACWKSHFLYMVNYAHKKFYDGEIDLEGMKGYLDRTYRRVPDLTFYLLVGARKPSV